MARFFQPGSEPETTPVARFAFCTDGPAHELCQFARDGQAEPRAAVAARGGVVGLFKGIEQARQRFGGDADAVVFNSEAELHIVIALGQFLQAQSDLALLGKFHGIAGVVE